MGRKNAWLSRKEAAARARLERELAIHCQIGADAAASAAVTGAAGRKKQQ